eukprot:TRINITY_DN2420_c0_g2_i1.p1 TRINITY_DN2420_c0_g2~~TRINITY_DN2420_c0_g2_i1.p1  ORF type:complete len:265 (+),score=42.24 TRINITY_DN2420_c0_g2_i1:96-890(+)
MVVAPPLALLLLAVPVFGNACGKSEPGEMEEEQCLLSLQSSHTKQNTSNEADAVATQSAAFNGQKGMIKWGGWGNYCLSVIDNKFTDGQGMQLWECVGSSGQIFDIGSYTSQYDKGFEMTLALATKFSLSVASGNRGIANGDKVVIEENLMRRFNDASQEWTWDRGKIQPASEMWRFNDPSSYCVTVDGNNAFNGAKIQMWKCSEPEEWQIKWNFVEKSVSGSSDCTEKNEDMYASGKKVGCCKGSKECFMHGRYICIDSGYWC